MKNKEPLMMDIRIKPIVDFVCEYHGIEPRQLVHLTRKKEIVEARQIAAWFAVNYTKMSKAAIGANLGGKDHATILYSKNKVDGLLEVDKIFARNFHAMYEKFKNDVLPRVMTYVAKDDYELGLFHATTLKEKTDVIKREYEKRLIRIYMHSLKSLKNFEKHINEDAVMEGFRKNIMQKDIQKSVAKLREYKMLQL